MKKDVISLMESAWSDSSACKWSVVIPTKNWGGRFPNRGGKVKKKISYKFKRTWATFTVIWKSIYCRCCL